MKTMVKIAIANLVLAVLLVVDIPLLPVEMVSEAEAVLGVRRRTARRTAVVAYSAGAATASAASAAAASSQQQAAAAQQQAAAAQQQAAAAQEQATQAQQQAAAVQQQAAVAGAAASAVPIGTVVDMLPQGCKAVTVDNTKFQDCGGSFYKAAFQGNSLVYVVVENPL